MTQGKAQILAMYEEIKQPYFALFYKGQVEKGNAIRRNDKEEKDYDYQEGKQAFERVLELITHGDYTIVLGDSKDVTRRGGNRFDFKIPVGEGAATAVQHIAAVGGLTMEEVETRASQIAETKFNSLMDKRELADTKEKLALAEKELRETEKRIHDPFNKLVGALAPHSENIIAGIMGRKPVIASTIVSGAVPDAVGEGVSDEAAQKSLERFVEVLSAAKPSEWVNIIDSLTNLIENQPEKFDMALTFLK